MQMQTNIKQKSALINYRKHTGKTYAEIEDRQSGPDSVTFYNIQPRDQWWSQGHDPRGQSQGQGHDPQGQGHEPQGQGQGSDIVPPFVL